MPAQIGGDFLDRDARAGDFERLEGHDGEGAAKSGGNAFEDFALLRHGPSSYANWRRS